METSDEALALAASDGDAAAFGELVERHYDRIFRLAFRMTGRKEEAEDLSHDICAALPGKIAGFRGEARFTTWLYRVVVNAAHDRRRRLASHDRAAAFWGEAETRRRAEITETAEALDWLRDAMRALPDDLRETLAVVFDGASHAEAGQALGVSEGTVSWRMSEVRRRLRELKERGA